MKTFRDFPIQIPGYTLGTWGPWRMSCWKTCLKAGYWSGRQLQKNVFVLDRFDAEQDKYITWMSCALMEQESQQHHMAAARGHVMIGGLGMGLLLYNVVHKPEVTRVVVVERDPEVIEFFHHFGQPERWPGWGKVRIVNRPIQEFRPSSQVQTLLLDVWPLLGSEEALPDTQAVQKRVQAPLVGFWGQEFDFVHWLVDRDIPPDEVTDEHWRLFRRHVDLPLVPVSPGFAQQAILAMGLQRYDPAGKVAGLRML